MYRDAGVPVRRQQDAYPLKSYSVGPFIPDDVTAATLRAPLHTRGGGQGAVTRSPSGSGGSSLIKPNGRPFTPSPSHLDHKGRWVASALPAGTLVVPHPSQPLSDTPTAVHTVTAVQSQYEGEETERTYRPVVALHSYADVSPMVSSEWVRERGGTKGGTGSTGAVQQYSGGNGRPGSATFRRSTFLSSVGTTTNGNTTTNGGRPATAPSSTMRRKPVQPAPFASIRDSRAAMQLYWGKGGGQQQQASEEAVGFMLASADLSRINDSGADLGRWEERGGKGGRRRATWAEGEGAVTCLPWCTYFPS